MLWEKHPHNSPLFCYFTPLIYTIETHFPIRQEKMCFFDKKTTIIGIQKDESTNKYTIGVLNGRYGRVKKAWITLN